MPKFNKAQSIGLAGEYVVGVTVTKVLGWPYRMQPNADMGLDGEIEVLHDDGRSTGKVIKVQCKATNRSGKKTRYVKPEHFDYWRGFAVPVLVLHPVLETMKVYFSTIGEGRPTGAYVAFDLSKARELDLSSKEFLIGIAQEQPFDPFVGLINRLFDDASTLDYTVPEELDELDSLMRYGEFRRRWQLIQQLAQEIPESLSPRAQALLSKYQESFDFQDARVNAVLTRQPLTVNEFMKK